MMENFAVFIGYSVIAVFALAILTLIVCALIGGVISTCLRDMHEVVSFFTTEKAEMEYFKFLISKYEDKL